jgi:hypothetical protein
MQLCLRFVTTSKICTTSSFATLYRQIVCVICPIANLNGQSEPVATNAPIGCSIH